MICAPPALQTSLDVNVDSAAGFIDQHSIVSSPSARNVSTAIVDDLHASGVSGSTDRESIVSSPGARNVSTAIVDDLHASGVAGSTNREGIVSSPIARNVRMMNSTPDNRQLLSASWMICTPPALQASLDVNVDDLRASGATGSTGCKRG